MVAARIDVANPTMATTFIDNSDSEYKALLLAIMYTPAVTMVAAWIKADTGVGPAIASGNHVYNGIWALFPTAPTNNRMVIPVRSAVENTPPLFAAVNTSAKLTFPS